MVQEQKLRLAGRPWDADLNIVFRCGGVAGNRTNMRSQRQVKTFEELLKANQYMLMKVHAALDKVIKKKKKKKQPPFH